MSAFAALLVCLVIVTLFFGELTGSDLSAAIATLFIFSMTFIILGLMLFLVEASISTNRIAKALWRCSKRRMQTSLVPQTSSRTNSQLKIFRIREYFTANCCAFSRGANNILFSSTSLYTM